MQVVGLWAVSVLRMIDDNDLYCDLSSARSFILDIQDKCWKNVFSKDGIEYMENVDQLELPDINDPDVVGFVKPFNDQVSWYHRVHHFIN